MMASILTNLCLDDRISVVIASKCCITIIGTLLNIIKRQGQQTFNDVD